MIMTQEEKARAYDEALERAKEQIKECGDNEGRKKMIRNIFPELHESEDEKTRKALIQFLNDIKSISESGRTSWAIRKDDAEMCSGFITYLEKQKEQKPAKGDNDFVIYHPLKCNGEYECMPYSFCGSLTSFSENKDLVDFLRTCFYTEEECEEWIKKQKEQKPETFNESYNPDDYEVVIEGNATSLKRKEQKPAEWSDEDERNRDRAIFYTMFYQRNQGTTKGSEECIDWLKSLKPQSKAEWSEEDGAILDSVIHIITQFDDLAHEPTFAGPKWTHPYTKELNFIKKLRNRLFEEND